MNQVYISPDTSLAEGWYNLVSRQYRGNSQDWYQSEDLYRGGSLAWNFHVSSISDERLQLAVAASTVAPAWYKQKRRIYAA